MPITTINNWGETRGYLGFKAQEVREMRDSFEPMTSNDHMFCSYAFSVIEHMGHLLTADRGNGRRFREYLRVVMSKQNGKYGQLAEELWVLYRCGTSHTTRPAMIQEGTQYTFGGYGYDPMRNLCSQSSMVFRRRPSRYVGDMRIFLLCTERFLEDLERSILDFSSDEFSCYIGNYNQAALELTRNWP